MSVKTIKKAKQEENNVKICGVFEAFMKLTNTCTIPRYNRIPSLFLYFFITFLFQNENFVIVASHEKKTYF